MGHSCISVRWCLVLFVENAWNIYLFLNKEKYLWCYYVFIFIDKCICFCVQGHEKEALQLMATYLPKDTSPGSAYQEGGGLYALGLIHANHGGEIIDYLLSQLKSASNDVSA